MKLKDFIWNFLISSNLAPSAIVPSNIAHLIRSRKVHFVYFRFRATYPSSLVKIGFTLLLLNILYKSHSIKLKQRNQINETKNKCVDILSQCQAKPVPLITCQQNIQ
ncbi:hypothetical protein ACFFRR_003302 [Megaselia abdita]